MAMSEVVISSDQLKRIESRCKRRLYRKYHTMQTPEIQREYQEVLKQEILKEQYSEKILEEEDGDKGSSLETGAFYEEIGIIHVPDEQHEKHIYRRIEGSRIFDKSYMEMKDPEPKDENPPRINRDRTVRRTFEFFMDSDAEVCPRRGRVECNCNVEKKGHYQIWS